MINDQLHDKETLFEESLKLKQFVNKEKGASQYKPKEIKHLSHSSNNVKRGISLNNDEDFNKQSNVSIHKSTFYYLKKDKGNDAPAAPQSLFCKRKKILRDEYNDDNKIHKMNSSFNADISKLNSNSINISFVLNQSSNDQNYEDNHKKQFNNPFDSICDDDSNKNNDRDEVTIINHHSTFNTNFNNINYKKSSTTDLIYEAPKYSNDILYQLRFFNPEEEQSIQSKQRQTTSEKDKEDNNMINNKKQISAFTITKSIRNDKIEHKLNDSDIKNFTHKSIISILNYSTSQISTNRNNSDSLQSIPFNHICNYIHPYQSIKIIESKHQASSHLITIINNNEFSLSFLKINTLSFNLLLPPITSPQNNNEEMITEIINKEFYDKNVPFSLFDSITSNLHKAINYDETYLIGNKRNLEEIKQYLNINTELQIKEASRHLSHYRSVLCDGDGFFRAFAFSLMERLILNNKHSQIKTISYNMTSRVKEEFKYNNIAINTEPVVIITKIILTHIENNQLMEAHRVFINAFTTERNYELGLIKYIKIAIADYIKMNFSKITKENQLIFFPHEYLDKDKDKNCLDVIGYINERILRMNYEPDVCVFYFAPIVFIINLQLIVFEKDQKLFNHLFYYDYSILASSSVIQNIPKEKAKETICIFHTFCRYYIGYHKEGLKKNESNIFHYNQMTNNLKTKSKQFNIIKRKVYCSNCKSESDELVLNRFQSKPFCKQCLMNPLIDAIDLIVDCCVKDDYKHKECKQ